MILPHSRCSFGVVFLVSILEVRSKEELQKLPMESMANLAAYLCHESCTSTGGVFFSRAAENPDRHGPAQGALDQLSQLLLVRL